MRVIPLMNRGEIYSSNAYLVLGDWSRLEDVNTLVDVGSDPAVMKSLEEAPTGVGKPRVEQVVLTHGHCDHLSLLPVIRKMSQPKVLAFTHCVDGVDELVKDGDTLRMGDTAFEVIHAPGHSSDSICLYAPAEGVLFAGDAPLLIQTSGGSYEPEFIRLLERLRSRDIRKIFFGHGNPLSKDCNLRLRRSLEIAAESVRSSSTPAGFETGSGNQVRRMDG